MEKCPGRQGVRQGQKGPVESAGVIKADILHLLAALPVRQGEGEAAALARTGFGHQGTAMGFGDPAAQAQSQPHAVGRRCGPVRLLRRCEERGKTFFRNAAAGVADPQQNPSLAAPQFHRDGAAGRSEFEGVGEQVIEQLLQRVRGEGTEMMLHGTGKPHFQIQQGGQGPGRWQISLTSSTMSRSSSDRGRSLLSRAAAERVLTSRSSW